MIRGKKEVLKSILESSEGIHLSIYLVNRGSLPDLKQQLKVSIEEADRYLSMVQEGHERRKLLDPLRALLGDSEIIGNIKGNIGIFRTKESFRILNLPVEVEGQCHVASSFHVKPLLKWIQANQEFMLIGINGQHIQLYYGNKVSVQKIDEVTFDDHFWRNTSGATSRAPKSVGIGLFHEEVLESINEWLIKIKGKEAIPLYLVGDLRSIEPIIGKIRYRNLIKDPIAKIYKEQNLADYCLTIRDLLKKEAKKKLEKTFVDFELAEQEKLGKKNIFQIAKAVIHGKVKKLIIADGISVFGKIDKKTGGLAIHPIDQDHEDDDLLDDLAQAVLASGGEVIIAAKTEIPKGRPILAILNEQGEIKNMSSSDSK